MPYYCTLCTTQGCGHATKYGLRQALCFCQVPVVASTDGLLLLHDRVDLQLSQQTSQALQLSGSHAAAPPVLQLLPDPAAHERMFAVHPQGMLPVSICTAWSCSA